MWVAKDSEHLQAGACTDDGRACNFVGDAIFRLKTDIVGQNIRFTDYLKKSPSKIPESNSNLSLALLNFASN